METSTATASSRNVYCAQIPKKAKRITAAERESIRKLVNSRVRSAVKLRLRNRTARQCQGEPSMSRLFTHQSELTFHFGSENRIVRLHARSDVQMQIEFRRGKMEFQSESICQRLWSTTDCPATTTRALGCLDTDRHVVWSEMRALIALSTRVEAWKRLKCPNTSSTLTPPHNRKLLWANRTADCRLIDARKRFSWMNFSSQSRALRSIKPESRQTHERRKKVVKKIARARTGLIRRNESRKERRTRRQFIERNKKSQQIKPQKKSRFIHEASRIFIQQHRVSPWRFIRFAWVDHRASPRVDSSRFWLHFALVCWPNNSAKSQQAISLLPSERPTSPSSPRTYLRLPTLEWLSSLLKNIFSCFLQPKETNSKTSATRKFICPITCPFKTF